MTDLKDAQRVLEKGLFGLHREFIREMVAEMSERTELVFIEEIIKKRGTRLQEQGQKKPFKIAFEQGFGIVDEEPLEI